MLLSLIFSSHSKATKAWFGTTTTTYYTESHYSDALKHTTAIHSGTTYLNLTVTKFFFRFSGMLRCWEFCVQIANWVPLRRCFSYCSLYYKAVILEIQYFATASVLVDNLYWYLYTKYIKLYNLGFINQATAKARWPEFVNLFPFLFSGVRWLEITGGLLNLNCSVPPHSERKID